MKVKGIEKNKADDKNAGFILGISDLFSEFIE